MTYADLVTKVMGLGREGLRYADPLLATGTFGASSDVLSAYAAYISEVPSVTKRAADKMIADGWISCPGGNTALLRHLVKAVFPDAITGPRRFDAIATNPVDFSALDRPGAARRMRLEATLVRLAHEGDAAAADHLNAVYEKGGRLYSIRARAAVLAIGSWVARHVVADLSQDYRTAFEDFFHGPILCVNVALHNWRFLDRLGISAAHWFDGFGFFANVRQPMRVGGRSAPFHPDKPAVLTFYVPFVKQPTLPIAAQGPAGRMELYGTSYADYDVCRQQAADLIVIGLHETGGLLRLSKVAHIAEAAGINICLHGLYETGITTCASNQIAATIPNLDDANQHMTRFLAWDIVKSPDLAPRAGRLPVLNGPGLGFEIDRDGVARAKLAYAARQAAG
jgi:hypothetical protein